MPPVQDSAVASVSRLARQAASTVSARRSSDGSAIGSAGDKQEQQERRGRVKAGDDVVRHDAEAAAERLIGPARRPRLGDVEQAEQNEAQGVGDEIWGG